MTPEQEQHLLSQQESFVHEFDNKYREGQKEHGGNLWENPAMYLIEEAIKENLDMYAYLHALRDKIKAMAESDLECCNQRRP